VRMLGDLLGQVLVQQEDEYVLADGERVRPLPRAAGGGAAARDLAAGGARARGARGGAPHDDLAAGVAGLPLDRQASVLRAFALYFQLANVAEQQHRIGRGRGDGGGGGGLAE